LNYYEATAHGPAGVSISDAMSEWQLDIHSIHATSCETFRSAAACSILQKICPWFYNYTQRRSRDNGNLLNWSRPIRVVCIQCELKPTPADTVFTVSAWPTRNDYNV